MQNHYNLVYREEEREMLPLCREEGIGVIPWSPLARGFLAGNRTASDVTRTATATPRATSDDIAHRLYYEESDFRIVERVVEVARARGVKPAQIALAWLLRQPAVVAPVVGASKLEHLDDAVAALEIRLSDEEARRVEELYQPHPVKM